MQVQEVLGPLFGQVESQGGKAAAAGKAKRALKSTAARRAIWTVLREGIRFMGSFLSVVDEVERYGLFHPVFSPFQKPGNIHPQDARVTCEGAKSQRSKDKLGQPDNTPR
jgi:hypothetical protein